MCIRDSLPIVAIGGITIADIPAVMQTGVSGIALSGTVLHADGVHLGKKDMPIADARRILGAEYIIGGTANTFEDVLQHLSLIHIWAMTLSRR